ncbi:MAG: hypothetical protein MUF57_06975 [Gammaproteobacteria bacterium]|jgi:hypothetical protein|nr:hypothetical protein [Gammaproteobacteria bacterium]
MPIAEIAGGIILALSLVAFWRVLLPFAGVMLVVAAALSYGHTCSAIRQGRAPDTAPVPAEQGAQPPVLRADGVSPENRAGTRPADGGS